MGASWRMGVAEDAGGALVTDGLFRLSRDPAFAGRLVPLLGVALAVPSLATLIAVLLFRLSARTRIVTEEPVPHARCDPGSGDCATHGPRWLGWTTGRRTTHD